MRGIMRSEQVVLKQSTRLRQQPIGLLQQMQTVVQQQPAAPSPS